MANDQLARNKIDKNILDIITDLLRRLRILETNKLKLDKLSDLAVSLQATQVGRVIDYDGNEAEFVLAERHIFPPGNGFWMGSVPGGSLPPVSTFRYGITFIDQYGESLPCDLYGSGVTGTDSVNKTLVMHNIPLGPWGTMQRRIYRQGPYNVSDTPFYLLATLNDNITTIYTDDGSVTPDTTITVPDIDASGSRPLLPRSSLKFAHEMLTFTAAMAPMTSALSITTLQTQFGFALLNAPGDAANGDRWQSEMWLEAGIYNFLVHGIKASSFGMFDLVVDGVGASLGNDAYAAATTYDVDWTAASVPVVSNGYHLIELVVDGKNAASAGYRLEITFILAKKASY